ncbi:DinB family protein [Saccharomonospora azurea]
MIVPDTKDWTWVLERRCAECGVDPRAARWAEVPVLLRSNAASWCDVLSAGVRLRERPRADRWSVLEYGCHVRDALRLLDRRLVLMLTEDDPVYDDWDQDRAAVDERYNEQEPSTVATDLSIAAERAATRLDGLADGALRRSGRRGDGTRFTVETLSRYILHDVVHHLHDVTAPASPSVA